MTFINSGANDYYPSTPYTCPHPLNAYTGPCDAIAAGTEGYDVHAPDAIPPTAPAGLIVRQAGVMGIVN